MKDNLILVFLSLAAAGAAAGCQNNPAPPRSDASMTDAIPRDTAGDRASPDSAAADMAAPDRVDAAAPDAAMRDGAVDVAPADGPTPDAAADAVPADAVADTAAGTDGPIDAGETCGAGVSREMLCTSYCQGIGMLCTGANSQYAGANECRGICNAPTWACGKQGDTTGNSLFCRLAHMVLAGVGSAAIECPNAGPSSPVCR
jgi:hypothetical protein